MGFVCGLVYLALHLNTVANEDYTSYGLYIIEYAYYVFVCSDLLLELYKVKEYQTLPTFSLC